MHHIRARLLPTWQEPWPVEVIQGYLPVTSSHSQEPTPQELPVDRNVQMSDATSAEEQASTLMEGTFPVAVLKMTKPDEEESERLLDPAALTIEQAIQSYLQEQQQGGRSAKTLEWHQIALSLFQQYLRSECHLLLLLSK